MRPSDSPLFYEVHGSGRPMLCLHGFGASAYTWRRILPSLTAYHKVYALDLKGFGRSPKPRDGHYSVHDQAALVLQFIADQHFSSVTLCGHSFGGGVALAVAIALEKRQQGLLTSLILLDAASYRQSFPTFIKVLRLPLLGPALQTILPIKGQVRSVLRLAYFNGAEVPDASVEAYSAALQMPGGRYALRETARHIIPDDVDQLIAQYPTIRVPTLLVWGRHDEIVPARIGQSLHEAIAGSSLVVIEDAGHVPHEERPAEVRQAIDTFLDRGRR